MTVKICNGESVDTELLCNYFKRLVNQFFKILPIRENEHESMPAYLSSLQAELLGCKSFIPELCTDPSFLSLLSILQYLIDYPECSVREVRREVFHSISICNKLKALYVKEV